MLLATYYAQNYAGKIGWSLNQSIDKRLVRKLIWPCKTYMQWFANFILLLDKKFDGSQKLHLANYTCCTEMKGTLYG